MYSRKFVCFRAVTTEPICLKLGTEKDYGLMFQGLPDCLKDCAFLLTGVLDSFERDEVVAAITKYGGCVKNGISKKVHKSHHTWATGHNHETPPPAYLL